MYAAITTCMSPMPPSHAITLERHELSVIATAFVPFSVGTQPGAEVRGGAGGGSVAFRFRGFGPAQVTWSSDP